MQEMNREALVKEMALPLYNARFWMKFMGVAMIIYGVMVALTIVGIIFAWLPIWVGVLLFQAAGQVEAAYVQGDAEAVVRAGDKLKVYFIINGVLMLIGILIGIAIAFTGGLAAFSSLGGMGGAGGMF